MPAKWVILSSALRSRRREEADWYPGYLAAGSKGWRLFHSCTRSSAVVLTWATACRRSVASSSTMVLVPCVGRYWDRQAGTGRQRCLFVERGLEEGAGLGSRPAVVNSVRGPTGPPRRRGAPLSR